jgi:hypothetical protein
MASITREILIQRPADLVWDAVRDVGAVHDRLARGFVTGTTLEPGARVVTFVNGAVAREIIVGVDEERRRLAYSVVEGLGATHHQASFEVLDDADGSSRLVWITDVLPDDLVPVLQEMVELGSEAIARTFMD